MRAPVRAAAVAAALAISLLGAACAEPPSKEMHQAQGAIDAARAAGAERYAPEEFQAAVDALEHAEDAVGQRDYRLALNHALDSRERAQNSAREAASERAQARSLAERALADVTVALTAAAAKLEAATAAKLPAKVLAAPRSTVETAQKQVQEAGTLLGREDYVSARKALTGHAEALLAAGRQIDAAIAESKGRKR
jgi:flagellar hook-basal body complex protein FliE